ncbi:MAG: hypothetical protein U1F59_13865 [Candidatus Competibacteraceae bacterium]
MSDRHRDENRLVDRVTAYLDAASANLDEPTRARLRAARCRAVDRAGHPPAVRGGWGRPVVAAALTVSVLVLILTLYLPKVAPLEPRAAALAPAYLEMLALSASPDLIEDLEFLEWLAGENDDAG